MESLSQTWQLFKASGSIVEVRALGCHGQHPAWDGWTTNTVYGYFSDEDSFVQAVSALDASGKPAGIFITLNPVRADLLARANNRLVAAKRGTETTKDADIVCRRWFALDFDPVRPAGISATREELQRASDLAKTVRDALQEQGWPLPVVAVSGNGVHLLYRVDLPNDAETDALLKRALRGLEAEYGTDQVHIDTAIHNASRIIKLYGTVVRKGDATESRPYRRSQVLALPEYMIPVSADLLETVSKNVQKINQSLSENVQKINRPVSYPNGTGPSREEIEEALACCPAHFGPNSYERWLQVLMAVHSVFPGPDGVALCEKYIPGYEGEISAKFAGFDGSGITHKTLFDVAKEYGFDPSQARPPTQEADPLSDAEIDALITGKVTSRIYKPRHGKSALIADALDEWGYAFSEDETDGTIYVSDQPIDEALRAEIRMRARDYNTTRGKDEPSMDLGAVADMISVLARENLFHPVRDWLDTLVWDGENHFARLVKHFEDVHIPIAYDGGQTVAVFAAFLYRWMLGAVARGYGVPDTQNYMLVIGGPQGLGKSFFAKWLCSPIPDLFLEQNIDPHSSDHARFLSTKFIWEVGELGSTVRRADREALKRFITQHNVTFRVPYAKDPVTKPALANFIGTINNEVGFLTDPTGNRRFLYTELQKIDQSYSQKIDVEQLWAQMRHLYRQGQSWRLTHSEQARQTELNEAGYITSDVLEGILKYYDIEPGNEEWWEFSIDITQTLYDKGITTARANLVGIELRKELGVVSERREVMGRRGRGFYGIRRKFTDDER